MVEIFVFKMTITYDKCIAIIRYFLQSNIASNLMRYISSHAICIFPNECATLSYFARAAERARVNWLKGVTDDTHVVPASVGGNTRPSRFELQQISTDRDQTTETEIGHLENMFEFSLFDFFYLFNTQSKCSTNVRLMFD